MKLRPAIALIPLLMLAACSVKPDVSIPNQAAMSRFKFVEVESAQNETGDSGNDQAASTFRDDLVSALQSAGVQLSGGPPAATLVVKPVLVHYEAGSAVARWIMPGAGRTQATVSAGLFDKSTGQSVGDLVATDQVAAGGLYTIGQDRMILSRLAGGMADEIRSRI
jgi:uncharacterized protein DUF4410